VSRTLANVADGHKHYGGRVSRGHLAHGLRMGNRSPMVSEPPLDRHDVVSIMEALFDLRRDTQRILALLEEDDGEEEEDPEEDT
jgi:hypothetical protein